MDKLAVVGINAAKSELIDAPYFQKFLLVLECQLHQAVGIWTHTQFIGEILDVKADASVLDESGIPDIEKVKPTLYAPESRIYYGKGEFIGKACSVGKGFTES